MFRKRSIVDAIRLFRACAETGEILINDMHQDSYHHTFY